MKERPTTTSIGLPPTMIDWFDNYSKLHNFKSRNALILKILSEFKAKHETN